MKNIKRKSTVILLATGGLLTTILSPAMAADEMAPFDGAYMGGAVTLNKSYTNATVTPNATMVLNDKSKMGLGLYAGFGKQIEQFYLGAEGGFHFNRNGSPTASYGTTNTGLKSRNTIDVSGRAGFVANQALFYGLAGYTSTNFETFGLATKTSKRLNGFRYGGGIEFAITPEMSIRGEYTHADYKPWNVANGTDTVRFDPSEHRFLMGASFRF